MEAKAKLLGHPIHQMLIVFPLGLLATSLFFDIAWLVAKRNELAVVSHWMIFAGVISGLIAAVFGLIDFLGIPSGTRAKKVGALHGIGNVVVVVLFAASWFVRRDNPGVPATSAIFLSALGVGLALFTGWLGGELVDRHAIGVHDDADLNARNSLTR
jgi:uncharacterized membrane protein